MKLDLKYRFTVGLLTLVALLPLPVLYIISDVIYFFIYHVVGYRRKVVRTNLNLAFGESRKAEIPTIERQFYHHLCDLMVETIKLLHISDSEMRKRFVVTNIEVVEEISRQGKSQVLMLGHYCNWEWMQAMSLYFNGEKDVVAQVYKTLHNKVIDRLVLKIRSRYKLENIPQHKALRRLLGVQQAGNRFIVGLVSDQRPTGHDFHYWTTFLGLDTPYVVGGEKIGMRSNAVFHYISISKVKRGHYSLTYEPLEPPQSDQAEEGYYTKLFLSKLEKSVSQAPQYWLWSHKIWKRGIDGKQTNYYR